MARSTKAPLAEDCVINQGQSFHFIPVRKPDQVQERKDQHLARSHAVKQALQTRRRLQRESSTNFFAVCPLKQVQSSQADLVKYLSVSPESRISFEKLAVNSKRLEFLLCHDAARRAAEPVFSVEDELVFQTFQSVFRIDLDDTALSNAVMLTLCFGMTGGSLNKECLGYLNRATKAIRERMSTPENAASVAVIGAILLLAGVEARLKERSHVELHMHAVRQLLEVCGAEQFYLNDGIKRAIFWQDLNCSIMTKSNRMFDHTMFAELQWKRDYFSPAFYSIPPGFEKRLNVLSAEFVELLQDIHALQRMRDSPNFVCENVTDMIRVDNHQASVQSRLMLLPRMSSFAECCYLAAYITACQLCYKVWRASTIPTLVASELLDKLQSADDRDLWNDHLDMLIWILHIGGSFLPKGPERSRYGRLLRRSCAAWSGDMCSSWPKVLETLHQFIWSENVFTNQGKTFWEEANDLGCL